MNQTVAESAAAPHRRSFKARARRHAEGNLTNNFDIKIRVAVNVTSGGGGDGGVPPSIDHPRSTFPPPSSSSPAGASPTYHRGRRPPQGRHGAMLNRTSSWPSTTSVVNATLAGSTSNLLLGTVPQSSAGPSTPPPSPHGLPPMAVHFAIVGALFLAVVILALINGYLHYRAQRRRLARRRRYVATVEERFANRRRSRRQGPGGSGASADEDMQSSGAGPRRNTRMTVRMKPTKMFV